MKGDASKLVDIMMGPKTGFIIPIYQRNYDWKQANCAQLFDDLVKLYGSGKRSHFFGSFVSSFNDDGQRVLIDGQQRITTVSLLLLALVNLTREGRIRSRKPDFADSVSELYLVSKYIEGSRKVKLKPVKKDKDAFDALIAGKREAYVENSNVTRNYNYFCDKITGSGLAPETILGAIEKLDIIDIRLGESDDPQLIFESLNSTGLDLSEADKVRNFLIMSLSGDTQAEMYENYWTPLEEKTAPDTSSFIRDYLTMWCRRAPNKERVYTEFKTFCGKFDGGKTAVLKDMAHAAKIWAGLVNACIADDVQLNRKLAELNVLNFTVTRPFFLAFFGYAAEKKLSPEEQYRVTDLVENYLARRVVCQRSNRGVDHVFAALHGEVLRRMAAADRNAGESATYVDVLKYVLLSKGGAGAFPDDAEIREAFPVREVYKMHLSQRLFLFERLENRDSRERHDVVRQLNDREISVEHIMPQALSGEWKKELGPDWERIHRQYLNTMANLTLTAYNGKYSNRSFLEKKTLEKGFCDSAFRLNSFLKTCNKWTETELLARQRELLDVFLKLWPMPETSFKPADRQAETAALDDEDTDFAGRHLVAFIYRGTRYPVKSWRDMLVDLCTTIAKENRSTVEWLCAGNRHGFSGEPGDRRRTTKIGPGMYVLTYSGTESKLNTLRRLFDECDIPFSDLVFELARQNGRKEELSAEEED